MKSCLTIWQIFEYALYNARPNPTVQLCSLIMCVIACMPMSLLRWSREKIAAMPLISNQWRLKEYGHPCVRTRFLTRYRLHSNFQLLQSWSCQKREGSFYFASGITSLSSFSIPAIEKASNPHPNERIETPQGSTRTVQLFTYIGLGCTAVRKGYPKGELRLSASFVF